MNRAIERILFGLMALILTVVLTNDTFRIQWQGLGVNLDIMATENSNPSLSRSPTPPQKEGRHETETWVIIDQ